MRFSAPLHHFGEEADGILQLGHGDALVGVVDQSPLLLGHGHAAEAVHMLADGAVVAAVAARQHQIGRDQHTGIGGADGALQPVPRLIAGLGDRAGFAAGDELHLDGRIIHDGLQPGDGRLDGVPADEPQVDARVSSGGQHVKGFGALTDILKKERPCTRQGLFDGKMDRLCREKLSSFSSDTPPLGLFADQDETLV